MRILCQEERPCIEDCKKCAKYDTELEEIDAVYANRQQTQAKAEDFIQAARVAVFDGTPWDDQALRVAQKNDPDIGPVPTAIEAGKSPEVNETTNTSQPCQYLFRQWNVLRVKRGALNREWYPPRGQNWLQLIVPHSMRQMIVDAAHHPVGNAHIMRNKMMARLRQRYWWPMMNQDVDIYLSTCQGCQNISNPPKKRAPMQLNTIGSPFSSVSIDWTGLLPKTPTGNRFLLTVVDRFTKWCEAIPIPDTRAKTIARALLFHFFLQFGLPAELRSDNGRAFVSELWKEVMELLGIKHSRALEWHSEGQGAIERLHRTLEGHLRLMIQDDQTNWNLPTTTSAMSTEPADTSFLEDLMSQHSVPASHSVKEFVDETGVTSKHGLRLLNAIAMDDPEA